MRRVWFSLCVFLCLSAALAQTPTVTPGGVLNAASYDKSAPIAPGSLVAIFGSNLAAAQASADSIPLSTARGDVQAVTFNGQAAPILFVSPGQINVQVPWGTSQGSASVMVNRGGNTSAPVSVQVAGSSPGIFAVNFGTGPAIAINSDGTLAAAAGSIPGLTTHPAKAGDVLEVLATGLGAVNQQVPDGNIPAGLATTSVTPTVMIGGVQAQVQFSGLSPQFPGVYQVNVMVPQGVAPGGNVPIQFQMGGITTTNQITIAVQ
ncbi:MAG TPA: IPT/TIG domain-containing protein [Bryobacteraceae bacterium]|nr:IPT/TIG domain-containing protein [Bryobacteraceae bacterium]